MPTGFHVIWGCFSRYISCDPSCVTCKNYDICYWALYRKSLLRLYNYKLKKKKKSLLNPVLPYLIGLFWKGGPIPSNRNAPSKAHGTWEAPIFNPWHARGDGIKEAKWLNFVGSFLNSRALKAPMLLADRWNEVGFWAFQGPTIPRRPAWAVKSASSSNVRKIPQPCKTFISIPFSTTTVWAWIYFNIAHVSRSGKKTFSCTYVS